MTDDRALDLVVAGGRLLDPSSGVDSFLDIGIRSGRIVAIEPSLKESIVPPGAVDSHHPGTLVVDAVGRIVTPGLIDLHTHLYVGVSPLGVPADETSAWTGVTTVIDAGSAGANTVQGFRRLVIEPSRTRVLAFLHISTIGLAGFPCGEAQDIHYLDVRAAVGAIEENQDFVVGVKVRQSAPGIVGENGLKPLHRALAVAEATGLPLMVHIGDTPAPLSAILALLRAGDVVTHCFHGAAEGIVEQGEVKQAVHAARERGVLFDVAHGFSSFAYEVAELAATEDFWPDTISTDLHSLCVNGPAHDLPTTMSKLMSVGMPLPTIIAAVTSQPARAIGRQGELGALRIGGVADIAILEVQEGPVELEDSDGGQRLADRRIEARQTIRGGYVWGGPYPYPGRSSLAYTGQMTVGGAATLRKGQWASTE